MNITFVTGNPSKAAQLGIHLDHPVAHADVDVHEIQGLDLTEIVEHKARAAYDIIGSPVLVEDTSLVFHALNGLPGPLIKWHLKALGNHGLCDELEAYEDRSATASVLFGLYDGETLRTYSGSRKGTISLTPRGQTGFGWDPIFIPEGHALTWGQMDAAQQKATSMRAQALAELAEDLKRRF